MASRPRRRGHGLLGWAARLLTVALALAEHETAEQGLWGHAPFFHRARQEAGQMLFPAAVHGPRSSASPVPALARIFGSVRLLTLPPAEP
jgi:hypothetical protein